MTEPQPPFVVHLIVVEEEEGRVEGGYYKTMCGFLQEHRNLSKEELRQRYVCAACQDAQNQELVKAYADLREAYNRHLELYHPEHTQGDHR